MLSFSGCASFLDLEWKAVLRLSGSLSASATQPQSRAASMHNQGMCSRRNQSVLSQSALVSCVKDWVYSTHNLTTFREYVDNDDRTLGAQAACCDGGGLFSLMFCLMQAAKLSEVLQKFPGARNIFLFGSEDGCDKRGDIKKTMDKIRGTLAAVCCSPCSS